MEDYLTPLAMFYLRVAALHMHVRYLYMTTLVNVLENETQGPLPAEGIVEAVRGEVKYVVDCIANNERIWRR